MQSHIDDTLVPTYQSRYKVLMLAIKEYLEPLGVKITTGAPYIIAASEDTIVPAGGFFTYISFPPEFPSADVIAKRAREDYALTIAYGEMFVVKGDETSIERAKKGFGNGARLCWAWHEEKEIDEGVKRLGELLKIMLSEKSS
jgi:DNA-binding transcriptional MocR family regulator